jgi:hypothetical protein
MGQVSSTAGHAVSSITREQVSSIAREYMYIGKLESKTKVNNT